MRLKVHPMNSKHAHTIANWHYEGIYSFYDMEQDLADLEELLDPINWKEQYYAVLGEEKQLVGFFCFDYEEDAIEIGLGLCPNLTGQGMGFIFLETGLKFARKKYHPSRFRLGVACFNKRAIHLYKKAGFENTEIYIQKTNGGEYEFQGMEKRENPKRNSSPIL